MRLVIGYDGSECAESAIADLRYAGVPDGSEATVLSVGDLLVETPYAAPAVAAGGGGPGGGDPPLVRRSGRIVTQARAAAAEVMARARQDSVRGADLVKGLFPGWTVHADAVADSPYWALIARAGEWSADLVVVGSHGRSALGRLILGSVSQNVLSYAPCSVRVGRCPPAAAAGGVRVLLGVDGSADAALAVEAVAARAWPAGTEVRVVTALDPRLLGSVGWLETAGMAVIDTDDGHDVPTVLRRRVDEVADELRDAAGLAVTTLVADGDPKHVLVDEADRWGAHVIFLGARGHTRAERLLLGSVSAAVAARARCSVEVVRVVV
jgi:nucleotide-binding universal stress UspA family protein